MTKRLSYSLFSLLFILQSCVGTGGTKGKGSSFPPEILIGLMLLVFWLFLLRPQAKKQKEQKKFIDNMGKGDKVVTTAGIHGTINKVNEDGTIQLEVSPGSYLKIERAAISMDWTVALNKPTPEKK